MTFLQLTYDSRLALLFCLDFVYDCCFIFFWLWLLPGPFLFVCCLNFDPCIPHNSDSCPALMICSPQCLTNFRPYSTTLTVTLFCPSALRTVTPVQLECRQLDCILPTGHCLLFCFVIFPLLLLKVIVGRDLISVGSWLHARFEPGKPSKTSGLVRFS